MRWGDIPAGFRPCGLGKPRSEALFVPLVPWTLIPVWVRVWVRIRKNPKVHMRGKARENGAKLPSDEDFETKKQRRKKRGYLGGEKNLTGIPFWLVWTDLRQFAGRSGRVDRMIPHSWLENKQICPL